MSDLHAGFQRADADARGDGLFAFLERVDGLPHVQAIKRRMTEFLGPSAGQHLLEVGCGMGHEVRRLAGRVAPGGSVLGIDLNHAMVDEARRRAADLGGAVRCQVGDVQRLELGDDAVDGVRTERVLMYVPDQQRAIGELARVVRPGGRVVAFELDYGATLVDLPDRGAAQRVPRPWPPRSRRGHSRLTPTGTGWRRRGTPSVAGTTATRSSGWSCRPASPSRAARRSPGNTAPGRRGSVSRMAIMTRPLGRTQADVTILGYGAMELRGLPRGPEIADEDAGRLLNAVLDGGINLIDTSPDYGRSEELIGRYVGHRRDEFFLASKCGCLIELPADALPPYPHDYSPGNVRAAVEQSLRRLRTDHLDLVQVHMSPDRATLEDHHTVETLQGLRDEGKVRFIGMSGILPDLPDHLAMNVFDAFQIPYSAVQRDHEELIAEAADKGAGTLIRGGAARGAASEEKNWRTGPLTQEPGLGQRNWDTSGIEGLLADAGLPAMEFVLRFTLSHPGLSTTIVGTANPGHLAGNIAIAEKGPLPADLYEEAQKLLPR